MKFRYFIGMMVVLFIVSCTSSKNLSDSVGDSNQLYNQRWNLVKLNGDTVSSGMEGYPFLRFDTTMRVNGNAGCNILTADFELRSTNQLRFDKMATTKMYCKESDSLERAFLQTLEKVDHYSIVEDNLLLFVNRDQVAVLERTLPESLTGKWELFYITGRKITFEGLYPDRKPFLLFDQSKGSMVTGNTGCNSFWSKVEVKNEDFKFSEPSAMTLMACPGEGEQAFLSMIKKINHYKVEGSTLTFYIDEVPAMRFQKVTETSK